MDAFKTLIEPYLAKIKNVLPNEDILFYHSSRNSSDENVMIDFLDIEIIKQLFEDSPSAAKTLNIILTTRGGIYDASITLNDFLRSKYDTIRVIVPAISMSCGTALAVISDELYLHSNCRLGAFDPQIKIGNDVYGVYSLLKELGINSPDANLSSIPDQGGLNALVAKWHSDYYKIEKYIRDQLNSSKLIKDKTTIDKILDRFLKSDHPDYGYHSKKIDVSSFKVFVSDASPLEMHEVPDEILEVFVACDQFINTAPALKVYIFNDSFYSR